MVSARKRIPHGPQFVEHVEDSLSTISLRRGSFDAGEDRLNLATKKRTLAGRYAVCVSDAIGFCES